MRQVALQAIARSRWMCPSLFHFCLECLVTDDTQAGGFRQKQFGHLRLVGAVALRAFTLRNRIVCALPGSHPFAYRIVTREAEGILPRRDHPFDIACMGVVAGKTLVVLERRMVGSSDGLFHEVCMTLPAQVGSRGFQDLRSIRSVRIMTRITAGAGNRLMDIVPRKTDRRIGM